MKEDVEGAEVDGAMNIKEETEDVVGAFEGITVGKVLHNEESALNTSFKENWKDSGKINKHVQVKISKFKIEKKLSLDKKENLRCVQCRKLFSCKTTLSEHIKRMHDEAKPHQCSQPGCTKKFGLKRDLKKHMMKVHGFEKPYPCNEQNCDEKFVELEFLKDHLRRAHGAAKLVCGIQNCDTVCVATFTLWNSLRQHKKRHHADK